jgi:hypothetical protein
LLTSMLCRKVLTYTEREKEGSLTSPFSLDRFMFFESTECKSLDAASFPILLTASRS